MDKQVKAVIIAIAVIIPISAIIVWNSNQSISLPVTSTNEQKIIAIASFYPLYEFTKQVGKEKVDASILVPFGAEPHDWEPTVKDLQKLQQADLVVINGVGFENWVHDFESIESNAVIVDTSTGISIIKTLDDHDEHESVGDPHIWLNPVMVKKQVENIANALMEIDPANKEYYNTNADLYIAKLDDLDNKIKEELSQCDKKDFIAFHSAFTYFANQYGLQQHTILESNEPQAEPTATNLENIIKLAKNLEINVIFTEEAVDVRTSEVIAKEIDGRVLVLSPIEIGDENTDYIEKMEQNLLHLKEALCN
ncbi:MAG: zinc ABC transporter substrate-binding protein [Thaumarchaeota archaeon]|nr:zinc ABC transporter substrate-binding protein [Nitrososphaerota archaeon]